MQQRLATGDSAAFAELYDLVADQVFHFLLMQTGSRDEAADLVQETFSRLFQARTQLTKVENLKAYVFRIARNELIRSKTRRRPELIAFDDLFVESNTCDQKLLEDKEQIAIVMSNLPDHFREVIELRAFANLTFAEIAEVTNNPQGTISTWYRRALEQMRSQIED